MRYKRPLGIFLMAVALTSISAWAVLKQESQTSVQRDATPVTEGLLTPKQIEHSKLYMQAGRKKISDAPDGKIIIINPPWADEAARNRLTFDEHLQEMTCQADAVVVATVRSKASQLTSDGTFIFTDYEVLVEDVLRNNSADLIQPKKEITVTRSGGAVSLRGKTLSIIDRTFKPLDTNKSYLLFLTYLPATGTYKSISSEGSFEISHNQLTRLTDEQLSPKMAPTKDSNGVINEIRALANNCFAQGGGK